MSELLLIKIFSDHIDTTRISDEDHIVGQFFRTEMKVKHRPVTIYYQF